LRQKFIFILSAILLCCSSAFAQTGPLNLYLTQDTANILENTACPITGMGTGTVYGPEDWTYSNVRLDLYVVVSGTQKFFSADLTVQWDSTFLSLESHAGNLFTEKYFTVNNLTTGRQRINIASLNGNVTPSASKHLVKLTFTVLKPGFSSVSVLSSVLRYYDDINDVQFSISVTNYNGKVKFYIGDFARTRMVINRGDGDINYKDVAVFGQKYGGTQGLNQYYRVKYDIYPTESGFDYNKMPVGDGVIDFYDMVLFRVGGYDNEANGTIQGPFTIKGNGKDAKVRITQVSNSGGKTVYRIYTDAGAGEISALSVKLAYDYQHLKYGGFKYTGAANGEMLTGAIDNKGTVSIDAVLLGSTSAGSFTGNVFEVSFEVTGNQGSDVFVASAEMFDGSFRLYNSIPENSK
jgi:hypothetical protein